MSTARAAGASQGVIDLRHAVLFASLIGLSLFVNTAVVELKKGS